MLQNGSSVGASPSLTPRQRGKACERCWKRKQKCDRSLPACSACANVGHACIPRKIDVEPITNTGGNLSHTAIPSYVETLKRKRDSLKSQIRRQRPRYGDDSSTEQSQAVRVEPSKDGRSGNEKVFTENTVEAAMGEIGFLSRSAMAEPRGERGEVPQELAMVRMVRAALAITGANPTQSRIDALQQAVGSMTEQSFSLKKSLASPFMSCFLDTAAVRFLHIDSANSWEEFEAFFAEPSLLSDQASLSNPTRTFHVYLAIATGMLMSPQSANLQGLAGSIHAAGVKLLGTIMQLETTLNILSCMISLTLYSLYSSLGGSAWHLIGLAMKKAIAFRFHKDADPGSSVSSEALNKRRNIFWSLYTLDRDISAIMDRPFSIEDEDITVLPPDEYVPHESSESRLALQTVIHARLVSGIRNSPSETLIFHYNNLADWKDLTLDGNNSSGGIQTMQLRSRAIVEILKVRGSVNIGSSLVCQSMTMQNDFLTGCVEYIQEAYRQSEVHNFIGGIVDAYDIFTAGIVIICLQEKCPEIDRNKHVVNHCNTLLTLLGERFSGLKGFRRVLWDLSNAVLPGHSKSESFIADLPPIIPDGIRTLILTIL